MTDLAVLRTPFEAALELLCRRRQNENADQVGARFLTQLLRALPIDVEQNVAARLQCLGHRLARRAIAMPKHFCPFQEFTLRDHGVEAGVINEMIIAAIDLTAALWARRHRYRKLDVAVRSQQQA